MLASERPRLRPGLAAARDEQDPRYVLVWDKLRLSNRVQRLTLLEFAWMQLCNGERTLHDIQVEAMRQLNGQLLALDLFRDLVERLDAALFLESPRFRQCLAGPVREPSCIGCYAGEPDALRRQLRELFTDPRGSGLPDEPQPNGRLRAALLPHIDYPRGGVTFTWGFKEVCERSNAELFVIIGTSHYSNERFTLTRKDFKTPISITSIGWLATTARACSRMKSRTCRNTPSSWKSCSFSICMKTAARSAWCRWWSARFTIPCRPECCRGYRPTLEIGR